MTTNEATKAKELEDLIAVLFVLRSELRRAFRDYRRLEQAGPNAAISANRKMNGRDETTTSRDEALKWLREQVTEKEFRADAVLAGLAGHLVRKEISAEMFRELREAVDAMVHESDAAPFIEKGAINVSIQPAAVHVEEGAIQAFSNFESKGDLEFEYDRTLGVIKKIKRVPAKA